MNEQKSMPCAACKKEIILYRHSKNLCWVKFEGEATKVESIYCGECYNQYSLESDTLGKLLQTLRTQARDLQKDVVSKLAKKTALEEKLSAGGPIAITEHILIVDGPRLKVIDHKKGYWAEAPLSSDSMDLIVRALSNGQQTLGVK